MPEAGELTAVADDLSRAVFALDDVDLNVLLDEDVRTLLETKATLQELTRRYRQDARAERDRADRDGPGAGLGEVDPGP